MPCLRTMLLRVLGQVTGQNVDDLFAPIVAAINGGLTDASLSPRARIPLSMRGAPDTRLALRIADGVDVLASGNTSHMLVVPSLPELVLPVLTHVTLACGGALAGATYSIQVNGVEKATGAIPAAGASGLCSRSVEIPAPQVNLAAGDEIRIVVTHAVATTTPFQAAAWLRSRHVK